MNQFKKIIVAVFFAFVSIIVKAQDTVVAAPENDLMRSHGRIYLVMTIVLVLIAGLLLYLISIDKKISKLENK
jgi:CcmD family protein